MRRRRTGTRSVPGSWHVAVVVENVAPRHRHAPGRAGGRAAGRRLPGPRRDPAGRGQRLGVAEGVRLLEYPARTRADRSAGLRAPSSRPPSAGPRCTWCVCASGAASTSSSSASQPDIYFPFAWLMRAGGARVVFDQRDLMPELLRARYPRSMRKVERVLALFERETQRAAHATLTVNHFLERRMREAGAAPERVFVVWNGPVLARVHPRPDPERGGGRAPRRGVGREDGSPGPRGPGARCRRAGRFAAGVGAIVASCCWGTVSASRSSAARR